MSQDNAKLPRPPIVEAVLDIDCDMPPGQEVARLHEAAKDRLKHQYPKLRVKFVQMDLFEAQPNAPPALPTSQPVHALQFVTPDEKQLVQLRAQGYSFNRLAPYTSLDDYLAEIQRTWRVFVEVASPIQVVGIRLRYINRIILPMDAGVVPLDDYFRIAPRLPGENRLTLTGFLNQYAALDGATGYEVNIVLTAQRPEGQRLPVIFDNTVSCSEHRDPGDWDSILSTIQALRELKNRIFMEALTGRCLDLFGQK